MRRVGQWAGLLWTFSLLLTVKPRDGPAQPETITIDNSAVSVQSEAPELIAYCLQRDVLDVSELTKPSPAAPPASSTHVSGISWTLSDFSRQVVDLLL